MRLRVGDGLAQLALGLLHQLERLGAMPAVVMRGLLELALGVLERALGAGDVRMAAARGRRCAGGADVCVSAVVLAPSRSPVASAKIGNQALMRM